MIRRSLLVGLAMLPLPVPAQPDLETFTGTWLYERYLGFKRQEAVDTSMFALYMSEMVDRQLISQRLEGLRPRWCQPEGAIMGQYFHIVGQYLEAHPDKAALPQGAARDRVAPAGVALPRPGAGEQRTMTRLPYQRIGA